jgi:hypothetical protein
MSQEVLFLPSLETSSKPVPRRQIELVAAAARSHAARVSHRKKSIYYKCPKGNSSQVIVQPPETPHPAPAYSSTNTIHQVRRVGKQDRSNNDTELEGSSSTANDVGTSRSSPAKSMHVTGAHLDSAKRPARHRHWNGNSDPFNTYPVRIQPWINDVFSFLRESWLPRDYSTGRMQAVTMYGIQRDWQDAVRCLETEVATFAVLSAALALISARRPVGRTEGRLYPIKRRACAALKNALSQGASLKTPEVLESITFLHMSAICVYDVEEAKVHANVLQQYFETKTTIDPNSRDYTAFIRYLQYTAKSLTRSLGQSARNAESIARSLLQQCFQPVDSWFVNNTTGESWGSIDSSLEPEIKDIMLKMRRVLWLYLSADKLSIKAADSVNYILGHYYWTQIRLSNIHSNYLQQSSCSPPEQQVTYLKHCCVALAQLCLLNSPDLVGTSSASSLDMIIQELQHTFLKLERAAEINQSAKLEYDDSILWAATTPFFVVSGKQKFSSDVIDFFRRRLLHQIEFRSPICFDNVAAILDQFLFLDVMHMWLKHKIFNTDDETWEHAGQS